MIERFSVKNFGSFDKTTVLEFSPGNSRGKTDHIVNDCLKSTVIFGSNAAGKSNLVQALRMLREFITNPFINTYDPVCNWFSDDAVTVFDIKINLGKKQYRYRLAVRSNDPVEFPDDGTRRPSKYYYTVVGEWLFVTDLIVDMQGRLPKPRCILRYKSTESVKEEIRKRIDDNESMRSEIRDLISQISRMESTLSSMRRKEEFHQTLYDTYILNSENSNPTIKSTINPEDLKKQQIGSYRPLLDHYLDLLKTNPDRFKTEVESELDDCKKDVKKMESRISILNNKIRERQERIESNQKELFSKQQDLTASGPILSRAYASYDERIVENSDDCREVFDWFNSSLVIIGTEDFHLPSGRLDLLEGISSKLSKMDVGITGLKWSPMVLPRTESAASSSRIQTMLSDNVSRKLKSCRESSITTQSAVNKIVRSDKGDLYLFNYDCGEETVYKMVVYHDDDMGAPLSLSQESDGTRRLIELCAVLLYTPRDRVIVVDELDRRLHPLLTRRFIELFMRDDSPCKQLVFTTHDIDLMDSNLFRLDEMWLVTKIDGESTIVSVDQLKVNYNKRLNRMYLSGELGYGVPLIDEE